MSPLLPLRCPPGRGWGQDSESGSAVAAGFLSGVRSASGLETVVRVILERVGVMLDARLEAFKERLPPPKSLRPPLGVTPPVNRQLRPAGREKRRGRRRAKVGVALRPPP